MPPKKASAKKIPGKRRSIVKKKTAVALRKKNVKKTVIRRKIRPKTTIRRKRTPKQILGLFAKEGGHFYSPPIQSTENSGYFDLPAGYGDNRIVLMIRDPYWMYTYWEINSRRKNEIIAEIGEQVFQKSQLALRVYHAGNWEYFDIAIPHYSNNWYINVPKPALTYCVEVGFITPDGKFIAAARSNFVTLPPDKMSGVIDEQWIIPDWDKLYALSGGYRVSLGSEEISSGWVSSLSFPLPGGRKK